MRVFFTLIATVLMVGAAAQNDAKLVEMGMSKEDYIKENHLEDVEKMIHKFMDTRFFLEFLAQKGHNINTDEVKLKRKDVRIGEDLDIYVKHITEHQNYTMILVPVDFYSLALYDTLLFSVMEVSDEWLRTKYWDNDWEDPEVKSKILSKENHNVLAQHMYHQAMAQKFTEIREIEVNLHESYITTEDVNLQVSDLSKEEKKEFRQSWGLLKKAFTTDINLHMEMNIYIFGVDDMEVIYTTSEGDQHYRITPSNIFTRHHFTESEKN